MCLLFCFPAIQKETRLSLLSQITTVILKKEFGILCLFSGPLTDAMKKLNSSLICFLREKWNILIGPKTFLTDKSSPSTQSNNVTSIILSNNQKHKHWCFQRNYISILDHFGMLIYVLLDHFGILIYVLSCQDYFTLLRRNYKLKIHNYLTE